MRIFIIGHKSPDLDAIAATVQYAEFLNQIQRYGDAELVPVRAGEPNAETQYIFKKFKVEMPKMLDEYEVNETDAFILVDHNEEAQRHEMVVSDQIVEVVDHHKINVNFTAPLRIDVKPVGSTSTLVYELFDMFGYEIPEKVAGLMLSGVLSDTVGLKSSTTTGMDSDIAHKLADQLDLDLEKLTFEIFKAKSDLSGLAPLKIAMKDYKVFDFGGTKVFINQVETVEPDKVLEQRIELIDALNEAKAQVGAAQGYLVVTDILKINSRVIYSNDVEKEVIEKAFMTEGEKNVADIGPKMSRKKDIAPAIENIVVG